MALKPVSEATDFSIQTEADADKLSLPANDRGLPKVNKAGDEGAHDDDLYNSDDEDDKYRIEDDVQTPGKISHRRQVDSAVFQSWVNENQRKISSTPPGKTESYEPTKGFQDRTSKDGASQGIIQTPREYQIELFERAKSKNIIVVLDTGSGKTLIAVLLMRHVLDNELEDRKIGKPNKVAFFIVEKVALCVQQHKVLRDNLEYPVGIFHGDLTGKSNTKEYWDEQFAERMAFVATAQVLLDFLNNGFISIRQINLLVFDEAHHCKKSHPFARIIKGHYMREPDRTLRPRILGTTASPVDTKTKDMKAAASELEDMLCSEIATVSDEVLMKSMTQKQLIESTIFFDPLKSPGESQTPLWNQIYQDTLGHPLLRPMLEFTREAASTLGAWSSDQFWHLSMTDTEIAKLTAKTETAGEAYTAEESDHAVSVVHYAAKALKNHPLRPVSRSPSDISTKVEILLQILKDEFCNRGAERCIVFVEKRFTAILLSNLLQQPALAIPGVEPSYMVGAQRLTTGVVSMSLRQQIDTLFKFKDGESTCLFATPVGEEGIDIPACDLVVRFDMYNSVIQYIQSRGRARKPNSRFINLVEKGNMKDLRRLKEATRDSTALQQFCSALPEDRKAQDPLVDASLVAEMERIGQKTYEIEATGARLNHENSIEVLARFTSSLAELADANLVPEYAVFAIGKKFAADVIMPDASPLTSISGFPQRSKQLARCSAAFEACIELIKMKHINDHLQPMFTKNLPRMRNARLAISSKKKAEYRMRMKPDIWSRLGTDESLTLYASTLVLETPQALGKWSLPLVLLTREQFPPISSIPLFFGNGHSSLLKVIISEEPKILSHDKLQMLRAFTLRIFADVFSKEYEAEAKDMPYFFAPSGEEHEDTIRSTTPFIDWECLKEMRNQDWAEWEGKPPEFFTNKLVVDPYDGSRKLIIHGINSDLKPNDPPPPYAPFPRSRAYRSVEPTIKQYSNSLFLKDRLRRVWRDDQPVVNAEILSLRRNFLDEFHVDEDANSSCCIVLEPLRVSPIPIAIVNMAMLLPAILHRIDSSLITLDACSMLGLDICPTFALEAMTKDSDNTDEHGDEQLNFQGGMGKNYERLEFLGDCFLKMATTISLFTLMPKRVEFEYHVERMLLINNKNLFNHAVDRGLQEYIRSKGFDRRTWYPDLKLKKGKAPKTDLRHDLADKSIADVCEALIGAAYLSSADGSMDMAVRAVTKMVKSKNHKMDTFQDYYAQYTVPDWQSSDRVTQAQRSAVASVKEKVGYGFESPSLLRSAFKHPAYTYEPSIPHYQRLEFLGDALLDMVIVDYLFRSFPAADPQWLTEHKMAMVSNQFLACLCVKLGLHKHILVTTSAILGQKAEYVADLERAEQAAKEEGQPPRQDFWRDVPSPPKALADVMEAFVGAMFVDSKYDYSVVQRFFQRFIRPYFEDMALYDTFANKHPATALAKRLQNDFACGKWRLCSTIVPCGVEEGVKALTQNDVVCALLVHEQVVEHATAKSGRCAKIACAKKAVARFADLDRHGYREAMGCDCKGDDLGEEKAAADDHGTAM